MNEPQPASRIETFKHCAPGTSVREFMRTSLGPRQTKTPKSRRLHR